MASRASGRTSRWPSRSPDVAVPGIAAPHTLAILVVVVSVGPMDYEVGGRWCEALTNMACMSVARTITLALFASQDVV